MLSPLSRGVKKKISPSCKKTVDIAQKHEIPYKKPSRHFNKRLLAGDFNNLKGDHHE
jgi:hypothetical protein